MNKTKIIIAYVFLIISCKLWAEPVNIKIITLDNKEYIKEVDSEDSYFCLFASGEYEQFRNIQTIEGLEKLKKLKSMELVFLDGKGDYSFLSELTGLQELYFVGVHLNSLKFLEEMKSLEKLQIGIYVDKKGYQNIKNEVVDFQKLDKLSEIKFDMTPSNFTIGAGSIPNFVNIVSKPKLDLTNNNIVFFSDSDLERLNQYSSLDVRFNPVAQNDAELSKINKAVKVITK